MPYDLAVGPSLNHQFMHNLKNTKQAIIQWNLSKNVMEEDPPKAN